MADMLETSPDDVLGKLIRVWVWFDVQSRDGNAGSVTGSTLSRFIDRLVSSQGFAACMKKVGWLTDDGIPNFEHHNGESAKKRALTNKRVKRLRNADDVTDALPEKRREEKKKNKTPLPAGFGVSESVRKWAQEKGYSRLEDHLAYFVDYARANGKTYDDWDAALRNCIKGNWAKLPAPPKSSTLPAYK